MFPGMIMATYLTCSCSCCIIDECQEGYDLDVVFIQLIKNIPSEQACVSECMKKKEPVCRSAAYYDEYSWCYLYTDNKYTSPDKLTPDSRSVLCTVGM